MRNGPRGSNGFRTKEAAWKQRWRVGVLLAVLVLCGCGRKLLPLPGAVPSSPSSNPGPELVPQIGHNGVVSEVAFSPDGKILASAGADQTVRLWEVQTGDLQRTLTGHEYLGVPIAFSPDGHT